MITTVNTVLTVIPIFAGIAGLIAGFGIGYAPFRNNNQNLAVIFGILGAIIGAVAGYYLSLIALVLAIFH
jgi:uncharacterized membrane protein HdeD (DUF308 family)